MDIQADEKSRRIDTSIFLTGYIILTVCLILPLQYSRNCLPDPITEFRCTEVKIFGLVSGLWYLNFFYVSITLGFAHASNRILNQILVVLMTLLYGPLLYFYTGISSISWGASPFGKELAFGYYLLLLGSAIIFIRSLVVVFRPKPEEAA